MATSTTITSGLATAAILGGFLTANWWLVGVGALVMLELQRRMNQE